MNQNTTQQVSSNFLSINGYKTPISALSCYEALLDQASELNNADATTIFNELLKLIQEWNGESALYVAECIDRLYILDRAHPNLELQAFNTVYEINDSLNHIKNDKHKSMLHSLNNLMMPPLILACAKDGVIVIDIDNNYFSNQIQVRHVSDEYKLWEEEI